MSVGYVEYDGGVVGDIDHVLMRHGEIVFEVKIRAPLRPFDAGHWRLFGDDGQLVAMSIEEASTQPIDTLISGPVESFHSVTVMLPLRVVSPWSRLPTTAIGPDR